MKTLICFLLLIASMKGGAQTFQGKLIYNYEETKSAEEIKQAEAILGSDVVLELSKGKMEYIVKENKVKGICFGISERIIFIEKQLGNDSWLLTKDGREINLSGYTGYDKLQLQQRTNETKEILGHTCRKYIYAFDNPNGKTTVIEWIAENLNYKKQAQLKKIFSKIISEQGLVMERVMIFMEVKQTWTLTSFEIYEVKNDELEKDWDN